MRITERRVDVDLMSPAALVEFIKFKGASYRTVAEEATRILHLTGSTRSVSKSTVGHLATGHIKSTNTEAARAICKALGVPTAALFVVKVSTVQRDVAARRAA